MPLFILRLFVPVNRLNHPQTSTGCSVGRSRYSEVASEKVVWAHPTSPRCPISRPAYRRLVHNTSGEYIQFPGTDIPGHVLARSWEPESTYDRGYPCCTPAHGLFLIQGISCQKRSLAAALGKVCTGMFDSVGCHPGGSGYPSLTPHYV